MIQLITGYIKRDAEKYKAKAKAKELRAFRQDVLRRRNPTFWENLERGFARLAKAGKKLSEAFLEFHKIRISNNVK